MPSSFGTANERERLTEEGAGPRQLLGAATSLAFQSIAGYSFDTTFNAYQAGRKFCATRKGYLGWVSLAARPGDFVWGSRSRL